MQLITDVIADIPAYHCHECGAKPVIIRDHVIVPHRMTCDYGHELYNSTKHPGVKGCATTARRHSACIKAWHRFTRKVGN